MKNRGLIWLNRVLMVLLSVLLFSSCRSIKEERKQTGNTQKEAPNTQQLAPDNDTIKINIRERYPIRALYGVYPTEFNDSINQIK